MVVVACGLVLVAPRALLAAPSDGGIDNVDAGSDGPPAPPTPDGGSPVDAARPDPVDAKKESATWAPPQLYTVVSSRPLQEVPGSASVIKREELRQLAVQNGSDALRTVPGINVVAEDAMGLRSNVGIRGLDPNRSRKVLILEDGMPVSLNPYGSPELYYTPAIERMDHLEVVKGSGQILWGPQTIGGVINYVTRDPPRQLTGSADVRYGSYNYLLAQAGIGATHGPVGWRVDVIHRRFEGPRRLDVALTDVTGKLRLALSPRSILTLKLSFYDEASRATYLGLTTPQYIADPTLSLAGHDNFVVRRYALGLTHQHSFTDFVLLQTTLYAYQTDRDWRRQEFDRQEIPGVDYERMCDGGGRCGAPGTAGVNAVGDGSSIYFRNSAAIRSRAFSVAGVEPRLTWSWWAPKILAGELTALVRFHYERGREQILIGASPTTLSGDPREQEGRNGYALAAAVQNRFSLWKRLHLTPGVRFESFWSDRRIARVTVLGSDGKPVGSDVDIFGRAYSWALIPGLGLSVDVSRWLTLFSGLHRGYAPPRTKDAVSPAGVNLQLDAELSWNIELGARLRLDRWLAVDVAGFHLEFENQIIPPSEAGGATSGMFNAGHSRHTGLEASVTFDVAALVEGRRARFSLPLVVNYTYLPLAALVGGLFDGNRLPYAPQHLLFVQLRFAHRIGVSAQVGLTYVSSQFADRENTPSPSRDGVVGEMPGYATLDARVAYTVDRAGLTFYLAGKNLMDQRYIANRAPSGIVPGGFRQIFGGIEWTWPGRR